MKICVFCGKETAAMVCPVCNDYKGLTDFWICPCGEHTPITEEKCQTCGKDKGEAQVANLISRLEEAQSLLRSALSGALIPDCLAHWEKTAIKDIRVSNPEWKDWPK